MPVKASPVFNMLIFRRDVYQLATMLVAERKIACETELDEIAKEHFEDQVNRLLMLVAVSARQLLEQIDLKAGWDDCGRYQKEGEKEDVLKFRLACSVIIHATKIGPYARDKKSGMPTIKINSTTSQMNLIKNKLEVIKTNSKLNSRNFLRCCTMLTRQFTELQRGNHGG